MNPFRHPPLLAGLARCRDEPPGHAAELLICADYCEDAGDPALARGLRLMARHQIRPAFDARRNTWRWEQGWPWKGEQEPFLAGHIPGRCWRLHPALYASLGGQNYETSGPYPLPPEDQFNDRTLLTGAFAVAVAHGPQIAAKHYSSFALAVVTLARLLAEPRQAVLPLKAPAPLTPEEV